MTALDRIDPLEGARWDEAKWHDEILWARDRQTRCLLALVCVHFDGRTRSTSTLAAAWPQLVFEYRKGRWCADGKRLDETRPDQVVGRQSPLRARRDRPAQRPARHLT